LAPQGFSDALSMTIPMPGNIESFNAAVAGSICHVLKPTLRGTKNEQPQITLQPPFYEPNSWQGQEYVINIAAADQELSSFGGFYSSIWLFYVSLLIFTWGQN